MMNVRKKTSAIAEHYEINTGQQHYGYPTCYQLYCHDGSSSFYTEVSVIGNTSTGISAPEYVSFTHSGIVKTGFLKKDENEFSENDIEFVITQIGKHLSVPMAEVIRTYEDPHHTTPHSIISVSVDQKKSEQFISFTDMHSELFEDLKAGKIKITPWIQKWLQIINRRNNNAPEMWDIPAESPDDCEACFHYPFETAQLWTHKHNLELFCLKEDILNMVMFDILVGQADRTSANYGLLVDWDQHTARLAPLFDNATLQKPYINEWKNGFNHVLIDRTVFAVAAYRKWQEAFLNRAADILSRENEIFQILEDSKCILPNEKLQFLKHRIQQSLDILNRIIYNREKLDGLCAISHVDELFLHDEIKRIFNVHEIQPTDITRIGEMGWEPKYRVATRDRDYFVKFSLYNRFSEEKLDLLKTVKQHVPAILIPLFSQNNSSINRQINIYPWIEGICLRDSIKTNTLEESYRSGIRCGILLREIHRIEVKQVQDTFQIEQRLGECLEIVSRRSDLLTQRNTYLPKVQNCWRLLCRPHRPTLAHLDFVPKNILIHNNEFIVTDWDSCAVADPWLDFFDKGLALEPKKQAWNAGIIDGYFDEKVPEEFWEYFKALSVYALLQSTVWAINKNDTAHVHLMEKFLCDSYDNFERGIPRWYEQHVIIRS